MGHEAGRYYGQTPGIGNTYLHIIQVSLGIVAVGFPCIRNTLQQEERRQERSGQGEYIYWHMCSGGFRDVDFFSVHWSGGVQNGLPL